MNIRQALQAFLDHRHEVLIRFTNHRLEKIEKRLEILEGFLIAYLNLDEIIRIIRNEDTPKAKLKKNFKLNEIQAEAILNMRLRQLRKLEEIEIKSEHTDLSKESKDLQSLLNDTKRRWKVIEQDIEDIKKTFSAKTSLGRRRTMIGAPPIVIAESFESIIEREPITILTSEKGWIRSQKGHVIETSELKYKEGDSERFILHAETTDKILIFATNGRFYTLGCDKIPGGRGHGEPLRLMIDLTEGHDVLSMFIYKTSNQKEEKGRKLVVASDAGRGFIVVENDIIAQTRNGKQIINLSKGEEALRAIIIGPEHDHFAVLGANRKLLIFPLNELPEMNRGRGVILQRYAKGGLSDITTLKLSEGLIWQSGQQGKRTETNIKNWIGKRAQAGLVVPRGFSRSNKFN
jgi:topoisomerase-4 subunit A